MLKKTIITLLATLIVSSAFGQDLLRNNYKRNKFVYTGAERVEVASSPALQLKLNRVTYPDGGALYTLRIDFESASAWKMPKNASIVFNLANGKSVMLKNASDEPNKVAPKGIKKAGKTVFLNYGLYYMEQSDLDKLLSGVTDLDATRRMSADGHVKVSFKNNEFSKALAAAYDAVSAAKATNITVGSDLETVDDYSDNRTARTVTKKIGQAVSLSLSYLYSAEGNSESYDLNLKVDADVIPGGSAVTFTTPAGSVIRLAQEKDLPKGEIVCYPDIDQLKSLMRGVGKISFETSAGERFVVVPAAEFAKVLTTLYSALQPVTIL
ncbi:MAG: hypothetical protein SPL35_08185 [Bacteroidales bacterium]|nr:hypothetical protein [Bacteroidales bacterium]